MSRWNPARPRTLVVACSDGRLQEEIDAFLASALRVTRYDRLYVPGGPGGLAPAGVEFLRASQLRRDLSFLIRAHGVEDVVLAFHGPAADGPAEATCVDYARKLPDATPADIRNQQLHDAVEISQVLASAHAAVRLHVFRCEVGRDQGVRFVRL